MLLAYMMSIGFVPRLARVTPISETLSVQPPRRVLPYGGVADTEDLAKRTVSVSLGQI
jgi:hypothetical protein